MTYRGDIQLLERRIVAIVGTRNPTPYGSKVAAELAANFADREWVVASGGAYGIDAAAHKGALLSEGETVAVMASGQMYFIRLGTPDYFPQLKRAVY